MDEYGVNVGTIFCGYNDPIEVEMKTLDDSIIVDFVNEELGVLLCLEDDEIEQCYEILGRVLKRRTNNESSNR